MGTRQQGCSCCLATHGDKIEQQLSMKVIPYIEVKKTPLAFIFDGLLVIWCGFDFKTGNKILKINCKLCIFLNTLPHHVVIKGITKIFIHFLWHFLYAVFFKAADVEKSKWHAWCWWTLCQHLDSGYSLDFIPALSHWRADYSFDAVIKISQRIYLKSKLIAV